MLAWLGCEKHCPKHKMLLESKVAHLISGIENYVLHTDLNVCIQKNDSLFDLRSPLKSDFVGISYKKLL